MRNKKPKVMESMSDAELQELYHLIDADPPLTNREIVDLFGASEAEVSLARKYRFRFRRWPELDVVAKEMMEKEFKEGATIEELCRKYRVRPAPIAQYLFSKGLRERKHGLTRGGEDKRPRDLGTVIEMKRAEVEKSTAQLAAAKKELAELEFKKNLRFEVGEDSSVVIIHGVTTDFIAREGLAKLRDWLTTEYPFTVNGNQR